MAMQFFKSVFLIYDRKALWIQNEILQGVLFFHDDGFIGSNILFANDSKDKFKKNVNC